MTDDVVIPINSRWRYLETGVVYRVADLTLHHTGPDAWVPAVTYVEATPMTLDVKPRYSRTKSDFLGAFAPA